MAVNFFIGLEQIFSIRLINVHTFLTGTCQLTFYMESLSANFPSEYMLFIYLKWFDLFM